MTHQVHIIGGGLAGAGDTLFAPLQEALDLRLGALPGPVHAREALASGQLLVSSFAGEFGSSLKNPEKP